jgi:hypothetical protein
LKQVILKLLFLMLPALLFPQEFSGVREVTVPAGRDTIRLDSLRIVPGSIGLFTPENRKLDDSLYVADPLNSVIILGKDFPFPGMELTARYRVFTSDPAMRAAKKETDLIVPYQRDSTFDRATRYIYREFDADRRREDGLVRNGSISRGVSFGNNQDVGVTSNLNLQLSGRLDDNINILASISDQNIPIQPEGYSQHLNEFDRIFIQLYNENLSLTAGDFDIERGKGRFLPLDRKGQGIQFSSSHQPAAMFFNNMNTSTSAAVSRGRYHRNMFQGIEGNQGPYKLRGANNELFIIVLAGSERVYIDGRLLARGVDNHYTVDYNLAEITFTAAMPITRDRRITVEFEYSDRNYSRFMLSSMTGMETEKGSYFVSVFSEHDARNQPLMQELREHEKQLLSRIGDSLHRAWVPKIDSVGFRDDMVLYEKADTLVNGTRQVFYRHSTDPVRAMYRLGFSYVGEQRGNYVQERTSANGRVFRWVAPLGGIPAGSYEPVTLLVAPARQQVVNMGGTSAFSANSGVSFEIAFSNQDMNTFSRLDSENNAGMALRVGVDNAIPLSGENRQLAGGVDYEFTSSDFTTTGRFRPVEHERDWNIAALPFSREEHKISWHAGYRGDNGGYAGYRGEYLNIPGSYSGIRNMLETTTSVAGFDGTMNVSYLNSAGDVTGTGFLRHAAGISRPLWLLRAGVRTQGENNRIGQTGGMPLGAASFSWFQKEIFVENHDTSRLHFHTAYREREDRLPVEGAFQHASSAREFSSGFRARARQGNEFGGTVHHRTLVPQTGFTGAGDPEKSLNGRLDSRLRFFRGSIQGTGVYETGSGLEVKRDFMFIEVPPGRGTHTWTDYNENGIKELDEFEPAIFPDQANYIRIFVPSDDFVRTRFNQFSQSIRVTPPRAWHNGHPVKRVLSRFSGQSAYRTGQKTRHTSLLNGMNPFYSELSDSNLINISSSLRNTLTFQPSGGRYVIEFLHQDNKSKNLLVNGFDTRHMRSNSLTGRVQLNRAVTLGNQLESGRKLYRSGFFPGRDHDIGMMAGKVEVSYQPGFALQTALYLKYTASRNSPGPEKADRRNLGSEVTWSVPSRGNISVKVDYFHIDYNAAVNTPLAWEMLEGLRPGNNMTMMVRFQQNITGSLQLSLNYHGRTNSYDKFIHTGGMQMRAFF